MSTLTDSQRLAPPTAGGPAFLPFLLVLFVGSGCSALIYEIVWFQLLEFAIGSSAASMAVLLGTFMGGLCLGSLLLGRVASVKWHPLRVYAALELGIGILGVLITLGLPAIDRLYASVAHGSASGIGIRAVIACICLLPPTLLMGATLPAIARWIETTPRGVSWLGFFYGGNTGGAVFGCLLAGFWLLPNFTMAAAAGVAAGINVAVAGLAILISFATKMRAIDADLGSKSADLSAKVTGFCAGAGTEEGAQTDSNDVQKSANGGQSGANDSESKPNFDMPRHAERACHSDMPRHADGGGGNRGSIYFAIALSGAAALGGEVIWTRLLSLLLGATVYTFSIILAVFLIGLGIGSSLAAMLTRSGVKGRWALAWCQVLCAASVMWTAYAVTNGVTHWAVDPYIAVSDTFRFQIDLARCLWAVLLPTLFWGASFPLALAAVAEEGAGGDPAKMVGRVYAANTVGAIVGALFFSEIAIGVWGSQISQHIMIALAGVAALAAVVPTFFATQGMSAGEVVKAEMRVVGMLAVVIAVPTAAIWVLNDKQLDVVPWQLIAWGRDTPNTFNDNASLVAMGEGRNSSVAVTRYGADHYFHVAGKVEASTIAKDMRLQLMLGHYPSLFHPDHDKRKSVLIVGCGAGVTAGTFVAHPHEKIVICELEPLVPEMAAHFGEQNNYVVTKKKDGKYIDPSVNVVFDDARHYVLTTDEKFDIITSDPIHPWVKGAACLYTKEYFEAVKARLNKGGLVTQWVPLYESTPEVVKSEIKTFFEVFPYGTVWANSDGSAGYDVILLGSVEPLKIDAGELDRRLGNMLIASTMKSVGLGSAAEVLGTYGGSSADLEKWTATGVTNHDADLRLQYMAGRANTQVRASEIQGQIFGYRRWPEGMVTGVEEGVRKAVEAVWGGTEAQGH
jgi:spermidine synthase